MSTLWMANTRIFRFEDVIKSIGTNRGWQVSLFVLLLWYLASATGFFPESVFPSPKQVLQAFVEEVTNGRLWRDIYASIFRLLCGFLIAVFIGVPMGICLGAYPQLRAYGFPIINFLRNISTLAWIPFAVLWFGIGDSPVIFLVFLGAVLPLSLSVCLAVPNIPRIFFRVAQDSQLTSKEVLFKIILPALGPQIVSALRLCMGLCWIILVAAEMVAGRDGLGFAVWDARNGLRNDILAMEMLIIGALGICLDKVMMRLTLLPSLRWGYER